MTTKKEIFFKEHKHFVDACDRCWKIHTDCKKQTALAIFEELEEKGKINTIGSGMPQYDTIVFLLSDFKHIKNKWTK